MSKAEEIAKKLKANLKRQIKPLPEPVCVPLSSGIDSHSILFTCLELGKEVFTTTFMMDGNLSQDASVARRNARRLGVEHTIAFLPTSVAQLEDDVTTLVRDYGCRKKVDIECSWPYMYIDPDKRAKSIVSGYRCDVYYGLTRRAVKEGCLTSVKALNNYRKDGANDRASKQMHAISSMMAPREVLFPFVHEGVQKLYMDVSWNELNKPKQKQPMRSMYPEMLLKAPVRPHQNLQCGDSGISTHFERLIKGKLNPQYTYKSVTGIYHWLAKKYG